jgi:hypothetical protein
MRNIQPAVAGAASGLINTSRQLGVVIGSAAVGALLQAQLASKLRASAEAHAGQVPPEFRGPAVNAFTQASAGSLDIGPGRAGFSPPAGVPEQAANAIRSFAETVFRDGFTSAMRVTLVLPLALLAAAALACLFVDRRADTAAGRLAAEGLPPETQPADVGPSSRG